MVATTQRRTAGLAAAREASEKERPAGQPPYTNDTYWAFIYAGYSGPESEQQLYDRATDSYCRQYGLPVEGE